MRGSRPGYSVIVDMLDPATVVKKTADQVSCILDAEVAILNVERAQYFGLQGVAAHICVLFTAADAHMREYALWVPKDAVASDRPEHREWALGIMKKSMDAETRPTTDLSLRQWLDRG